MKFSNDKKDWGKGRIGEQWGGMNKSKLEWHIWKFRKSNSKLMSSIVNISVFHLRNIFSVEILF